ncbi:MAG: leucyl aminopeptidase [Acidobacteria bacterium]|jgi:leucyl aminopeptidase|nr:MAG: leucyl aminopeptidase [Acidobacteriota bacterium]
MEVNSLRFEPLEIREPLGILLYEDDWQNLDFLGSLKDNIKRLADAEGFKGKEESLLKLSLIHGDNVRSFYLLGLGKRERANVDSYRTASALVAKRAQKDGAKSLYLYAGSLDYKLSKAITEGAILGVYRFDKYKTKKEEDDKKNLQELFIYGGDEEGIRVGKILAQAQNFTRDIVNEPGNVINPVTLAELAQRLAQEYGLQCKVYDEKEIQNMGMNALWSVGKGSSTPPRFVHITYRPEGEPKERIALVGKGLTFDSGGLNIKTGDYMRTMKMDKSGACAVLGIMKAIAQLKPQVEVHAIFGAAENMPSGTAYRPDDIIRAMNGKTIEIDNTDAEGRVTLADALSYASNLGVSRIIDMATLTGACMVALGEYTAGLFTNDEEFGEELLSLSKETGERMWKLPMDDKRLREKIRKGDGDLLNSGGRYGGAITAAMFLEEFVGEGIKWVHLDIAGPAHLREEFSYYSKGGTGFGVRTCVEYILKL